MITDAPFLDAMRSQPEQLASSYLAIQRDLEAATLSEWKPGETIGVVAMGASANAGQALVATLSVAGFRAVNLVASELLLAAPGHEPADHYVIVSESGRSPETIEAARRLSVGRRIGISNAPDAPMAGVVDASIGLGGFADSAVYTVGYTATLLAYALLLDRVGVMPVAADLAEAPRLVAEALAAFDALAATVGSRVAAADSVDVVGQGVSLASARELALMIREGLRRPTGCYETFEYLHGPMEAARPGSLVVAFGDGRELTVPGPLLNAGVRVVLVTSVPGREIPDAGHPLLTIVHVPAGLSGFVRAIVEAVFAQLVLAHGVKELPFSLEEFRFEDLGTKVELDPAQG